MTRTVFKGGRLFDGTGAPPADGDVAVEDGRIVGVGSGLDGDEAVDVEGPDDSAGTLRLPRPRLGQRCRPVGGRPAAVLAPVLRGRAEPRGDAPSGNHEASGFGDTHLGRIGKAARAARAGNPAADRGREPAAHTVAV